MKIIKRGNTYRKANWLQQNEYEIYVIGCTVVGFFCFVVGCFIRG